VSTKPEKNTVSRPLRRGEYVLRFAEKSAEKGWNDLIATARNAAVDCWEFLTTTPMSRSARCYPLQGELGAVQIDGITRERWQYKPTNGGRVWYVVAPAPKGSKNAGEVLIERVLTGHPNQTVKNFR